MDQEKSAIYYSGTICKQTTNDYETIVFFVYFVGDSYMKSTYRCYLPPLRNEAEKRGASFENMA